MYRNSLYDYILTQNKFFVNSLYRKTLNEIVLETKNHQPKLVDGLVIKFIIAMGNNVVRLICIHRFTQRFQINLRNTLFICSMKIGIVEANKCFSEFFSIRMVESKNLV